MQYSPTAGLGRLIRNSARMGRKYGLEWWILVGGALIILGVVSMALFAGILAPYNPHDQNAGPQLAPPSTTLAGHG